MDKYDMIIVGAGTAGCSAARTAAGEGLKVCLIDRKKREEIGEKVCGDALGEHHLKELGLEKPQGGELEKRIGGIKIYSPNLDTVFTVAHEDFVGYMLNRRLFGQWLLKRALDKGAILLDSTQCLEPEIEKGFLTGVMAKDVKSGKNIRLKAKAVVDASGFMGVIRRKLPKQMGIETEVENDDVEACYREIRQLKQETENQAYCEIYLNQTVTPGGYTWIFPKGGARVNAGLGICMRGGFPSPKGQFYKHILTKQIFEGSLLLHGGAWYDPTRKPMGNMVGNGVAIVGDSACQVNPIHGGGIGPSMLGGHLAGQVIVDALERGVADQKSLWPYNQMYMQKYGAKQAGLDVLRMVLLKSRNEDLNYGMKYELLTQEDILRAGLGEEMRLKVTDTAKRVFRGLKRIRFLNKLRLTVSLVRQVKAHYTNYPETPMNFKEWQMKTDTLFKEAKTKILE